MSVADVMKQAGYATGMCGKWHMGFEDKHHPMARGFDEFFGFLSGAHQYLPKGVPGVRIVGNEGGAANQIMRGKEPIKEETYLTEAFAREPAPSSRNTRMGRSISTSRSMRYTCPSR